MPKKKKKWGHFIKYHGQGMKRERERGSWEMTHSAVLLDLSMPFVDVANSALIEVISCLK